jgi:hypothetical protein
VTDSNIGDLMSITGRTRDDWVGALVLTQGNLEMAASVLFEGLTLQQMQQAAAQNAMGGDDDGDDGGMPPGMGGMPMGGQMGGNPMAGGMPGAGGNPLAELA